MLVVTANWLISDGTISAPPPRAALGRFRAGIARAAVHAGWRRDGHYRPIERIDLVFAGDTFDALTSTEWLGRHRPWRRGGRGARERVVQGTVRSARPFLARVVGLTRRGIEVPRSDSRGRPAVGASVRVPVSVTLLAGDRDAWVQERAAAAWAGRLGAAVGACWSDGDVAIRHGSEFDCSCAVARAEDGRQVRSPTADRPPTLQESLAIDLVARFGHMLAAVDVLGSARPDLMRSLAAAHAVGLPWRLRAWLERGGVERGLAPAECAKAVGIWCDTVDLWARAARHELGDESLGGVVGAGCGIAAVAEWMTAAARGEDATAPAPEWALRFADIMAGVAAGGAEQPRVVVLGHPAPPDADLPVGRGPRVVCLGPPAVRRYSPRWALVRGAGIGTSCVAMAPVDTRDPPAVVVLRKPDGRGAVLVEELHPSPGAPPFVRPAADEAGIVDAA